MLNNVEHHQNRGNYRDPTGNLRQDRTFIEQLATGCKQVGNAADDAPDAQTGDCL